MSTRVIFATPNQARQDDMRRLLADIDVVLSRFGPPVPRGAGAISPSSAPVKTRRSASSGPSASATTTRVIAACPPWRAHTPSSPIASSSSLTAAPRIRAPSSSTPVFSTKQRSPSAA